ncbi:GATA-type zinc finger protein 1 [Phyllopteryx taeniolatus]|uniref:GATA-type zinc finger protein 1 n=1 Tax=Phyllopteryx taeniolatus TaxID=161469 RepID=UPI002AD45273|nr:GATA-type zinc finger protein 1 [Phyllopteryx taeniolatus]
MPPGATNRAKQPHLCRIPAQIHQNLLHKPSESLLEAMSTGQRSQVALLQRRQREPEKDASESALVYLFQEVSNLEASLQSGDPDTRSLSYSLKDGQAKSVERAQTSSIPTLRSPCERDDHVVNGHVELVTERPPGTHSPWRSLSLINLQCERLMDLREESEPRLLFPNICGVPSAHGSGSFEGTDASVECTLRPAPVPEAPASSRQFKADPESSVDMLLEGSHDSSPIKHDHADTSVSGSSLSHVHVPDASPNSQTGLDRVERSRPARALDRNANLMLSRHAPSQPGDRIVSSKSHGARVPIEGKLRRSPATAAPSQLTSNEGNETPVSRHSRRTKTPRKQPNPRRSADIRDPHFQGVTFRIDAELDDDRDECRLLITSKYSRELYKSVRKRRRRTRMSRTACSTDEEREPTASRGKVCASCCTTKTPMWRDAEDGTPLCNACGIRYKKYKVRCVNCWHIPKKESNSNTCCLKCGNFVRRTSTQHKHTI